LSTKRRLFAFGFGWSGGTRGGGGGGKKSGIVIKEFDELGGGVFGHQLRGKRSFVKAKRQFS